ncbi:MULTISPECIES: hypothetical protein [unclassified Adlercreutzia]|uniref:hypothetical protein n=1 Tax=unclassified Adlercreutzia TaxID=2636013 RepID=UPI0013EDAC3E|nr:MULTISPECIES: hypothetical protein [unclassified Adlercreutzia]
MYEVEKLEGIINGIDLDREINEKEIARLRLWADRNRDVAIEPREVELVRIVDEVLEDGFLTEQEKEELFFACASCESLSHVEPRLLKLAGIVDGLLCDGVVNEKEVHALRAWLEDGRDLKGIEAYDFVEEQVSAVLEDGVYTPDEARGLFSVLSKRLRYVRYRYAVEHLKKKVRRGELIGLDLINALNGDCSIERVHLEAERQLNSALRSFTGIVKDKEIVFISLVLIGLCEYDSAFYEGVEKAYPSLYQNYSDAKVESLIRDVLSHFQTQQGEYSESRYINVALRNAIVPQYYLPAFFDFVFDIYDLNLGCRLSADPKEDFRFAFEGLHEKLLDGGDDLEVEVTKRTYRLVRSTKDVIANEDTLDEAVALSVMVARIIDGHMRGFDVRPHNPYFRYGYERWASSISGKNARRARAKGRFAGSSRWEPRFTLKENIVHLAPPEHLVGDCYDYRDLGACVLLGDDRIIPVPMEIRSIIGGYRLIIDEFPLDDPLGNVRYRITAKADVLFDSACKLRRPLLVFDLDGNEVKNNTDYDGTVIVCYRGETKDLQPYYQCDGYALATYDAKIGDALTVGDEVFTSSK